MKIKMNEVYATLLGVSENLYYKHKRENRPIIRLLDKYFSKYDLKEFVDTGKVEKYDEIVDCDQVKQLFVKTLIKEFDTYRDLEFFTDFIRRVGERRKHYNNLTELDYINYGDAINYFLYETDQFEQTKALRIFSIITKYQSHLLYFYQNEAKILEYAKVNDILPPHTHADQ